MGVNIQTIKDIRFYLTAELNEIYQDPELTSLINIIIKTVPGLSGLHQLYISEQPVTPLQEERIIEICNQLQKRIPIQYVLGETFFYGCRIMLNKYVLIPRPETEELVHLLINENKGYSGEIIDFGTGSGCIAIAVAANMPDSNITGIDISVDALSIARENAILNSVKVSFIEADIFNFDYNLVQRAGIIISNPPYVRNSEKSLMSKNVLDYEPHLALFVDDSDPLIYYKAILKIAQKTLLPEGKIYFEINEAMGDPMLKLLTYYGYKVVRIIADINGRERMIKGTKNG